MLCTVQSVRAGGGCRAENGLHQQQQPRAINGGGKEENEKGGLQE